MRVASKNISSYFSTGGNINLLENTPHAEVGSVFAHTVVLARARLENIENKIVRNPSQTGDLRPTALVFLPHPGVIDIETTAAPTPSPARNIHNNSAATTTICPPLRPACAGGSKRESGRIRSRRFRKLVPRSPDTEERRSMRVMHIFY